MITNPIYKPKGEAAQYAEYALNIFEGCPHQCSYCYVPQILHKTKQEFFNNLKVREGIVEATIKQLEKQKIENKLIHLCFTCDPYPYTYMGDITRQIIELLKEYYNDVQILTKNPIERDFDLLDEYDWFGITLTGEDDNVMPEGKRIEILKKAWSKGINTWISFEPVLNAGKVLEHIQKLWWVDKMAVGKLNYQKSDINWKTFGIEAEKLLKQRRKEYSIKNSLRKEMGI
jgi:DNA repair photolyase